jgi:hypothetical protein
MVLAAMGLILWVEKWFGSMTRGPGAKQIVTNPHSHAMQEPHDHSNLVITKAVCCIVPFLCFVTLGEADEMVASQGLTAMRPLGCKSSTDQQLS